MVIGLGVDLVEPERVQAALARWGERFVHKLMDPEEALKLPAAPLERARALAWAVAGKEAASKAIGTGWTRGVRWRDVVVTLGPPPAVELRGAAARVARGLGSTGESRVRFEERQGVILAEVRLLGR